MDTQLFFDIGVYAGIMMLITVVIDILKKFGVIKTPELGGKIAGIVQTILSAVLWAIGTFAPDWLAFVPVADEIAGALAELGAGVVALLPLIVKLGNLFHDVFADMPGFNKLIAHRVD